MFLISYFQTHHLPVLLLTPLVGMLLVPLAKRQKLLYHIVAGTLSFGNLLVLLDTPTSSEIAHFGPLQFQIDRYSWLFVFLINVSAIITLVYAYNFTKFNFQDQLGRFYFYLSTAITLVTANGLAGNLFTLFATYVLTVLAVYPLVDFRNTERAHLAARSYLLSLLVPAFTLFLPVVLYIYFSTGYQDFVFGHYTALRSSAWVGSAVIALLVLGISANSVMPFHRWLPMSSVAPAPISALLHSVAVVNMGVVALVKVAVYIIGYQAMHQLSSHIFETGWIQYLTGATAIYAAWRAFKTTDLKERFAWSTVSQLSYMVTAIVIGTPVAIMAAAVHMVTHAFAKSMLFYIAGFYNTMYNTVSTGQVASIAPWHRGVVACVGISATSIIGFVPYLAGYESKHPMMVEAFNTGNYPAVLALVIGGIINIMYIWPVIKAGFFTRRPAPVPGGVRAVPVTMQVAIGLCLAGIIGFSIYGHWLIEVLSPGGQTTHIAGTSGLAAALIGLLPATMVVVPLLYEFWMKRIKPVRI